MCSLVHCVHHNNPELVTLGFNLTDQGNGVGAVVYMRDKISQLTTLVSLPFDRIGYF